MVFSNCRTNTKSATPLRLALCFAHPSPFMLAWFFPGSWEMEEVLRAQVCLVDASTLLRFAENGAVPESTCRRECAP